MAVVLIAAAPRRHARSGGIDFSFELPANFEIGRFKRTHVFPDAAVFVEKTQLRDYSITAIPVGEVPCIILDAIDQDQFEFLKSATPRFDRYEMRIDGRRVWKLPRFPGPYGREEFYYVAAVGRGHYVEILGHRKYFRGDGAPTHYDRVIERLIATLAR